MSAILPLELDTVTLDAGQDRLLHGINHRFEAGGFSMVLGPNGAGKSLLLRLCNGLIRPTSGHIIWHGPQRDEAKAFQAFVFQQPVLLRRSVRDNISYPLALRGEAQAQINRLVDDALSLTGLSAIASRPARVLSGGEKQRLAIARAWVVEPEVLFLDEPTASLDPRATHDVERLITAIHAAGTKIIMTSHDLAQVRRLADDIVFLNNGHLVESGAADELMRQPRTPQLAAFLKGDLVL